MHLKSVLLLSVVGAMCVCPGAWGAPLPKLESDLGRYLLSEVPEGMAVVERLLGRRGALPAEWMRVLREPEMEAVGRELDSAVGRIDELLERYRVERPAEGGRSGYSAEERLFLREVAIRELALNPAWRGARAG